MPARAAELSDAGLLRLVADGDRGAFERLYDRYASVALGHALNVVGERALAEEATQDAFLSVWRKAGCFRPELGSAHGWILGIVRHRALDAVRRRQTHARRRVDLDPAAVHLEAAERTDTEVERREGARDLHSALHRLPAEQRHPIELAYFAGCSQSEISERLLVPLGTVKSRMRLGLERLRTNLPHATA